MEISQRDQRWLENQSMSLIDICTDLGTAMDTKELRRPLTRLKKISERVETILAKAQK